MGVFDAHVPVCPAVGVARGCALRRPVRTWLSRRGARSPLRALRRPARTRLLRRGWSRRCALRRPRTYPSAAPRVVSPLRLRRAGVVVGAVTDLRGRCLGLLSLYVPNTGPSGPSPPVEEGGGGGRWGYKGSLGPVGDGRTDPVRVARAPCGATTQRAGRGIPADRRRQVHAPRRAPPLTRTLPPREGTGRRGLVRGRKATAVHEHYERGAAKRNGETPRGGTARYVGRKPSAADRRTLEGRAPAREE